MPQAIKLVWHEHFAEQPEVPFFERSAEPFEGAIGLSQSDILERDPIADT